MSMRMLMLLTAFVLSSLLPAIAAPHWETSLDAARHRAAREHRPILLLQMFGRLDEQFC
jgi:hypothetical protein